MTRRRTTFFPASGPISSIPRMGSDFAQMAQGVYSTPNGYEARLEREGTGFVDPITGHATPKGKETAAALQLAAVRELLKQKIQQSPGAFSEAYPEIEKLASDMLVVDQQTAPQTIVNPYSDGGQAPVAPGTIVNPYAAGNIPESVRPRHSTEFELSQWRKDYNRSQLELQKLQELTQSGRLSVAAGEKAMQAWQARYGHLDPPPKTRDEIYAEERAREQQVRQESWRAVANGLGHPELAAAPWIPDEHGVLQPPVKIGQLLETKAQERAVAFKAAQQAAKDKHNEYLAEGKLLGPVPDPTVFPDKFAEWQTRAREIKDRYYPPKEGAQSPTTVVTAYQDGSTAEGAFKAGRIKPGQPFTVRGKSFVFDKDGQATRVE